jgi:hypothetical protein
MTTPASKRRGVRRTELNSAMGGWVDCSVPSTWLSDPDVRQVVIVPDVDYDRDQQRLARAEELTQALLEVWERNYGRFIESMGKDNPRLESLDEAIGQLCAWLAEETDDGE